MESPPNILESLFERIETYSLTTLELSKYKFMEMASNVITLLASRFIVLIVMVIFIIFFSIGIAFYLGDVLEKPYYGFFIVSVFYLLIGTILFFSLHKWIKEPIGDFLISQMDADGIERSN